MKKNLIIAAAVSAALVSGATFADAKAITGVTMGLQAGIAGYQGTPSIPTIVGANVSETKGGFLLGGTLGYDFALSNQFAVGIETGINNGFNLYKLSISNNIGDSVDFKMSDLSVPILLKAIYVMPFGLNIFVKGGMAYHKYKLSVDTAGAGNPGNFSDSYSKWAPEAAVGLGYMINNFNVFAQYSHTFGKKLDDNGLNKDAISTNAITAGVSYTLPM